MHTADCQPTSSHTSGDLFFAILHQIMQSVYEESGRNFIEMRPRVPSSKHDAQRRRVYAVCLSKRLPEASLPCAAVPAQLLHRVGDRVFAGKPGRAVRCALRIIRILPFLVKSGNSHLMVENYVNLW